MLANFQSSLIESVHWNIGVGILPLHESCQRDLQHPPSLTLHGSSQDLKGIKLGKSSPLHIMGSLLSLDWAYYLDVI
jgi:hypothetical protein